MAGDLNDLEGTAPESVQIAPDGDAVLHEPDKVLPDLEEMKRALGYVSLDLDEILHEGKVLRDLEQLASFSSSIS